MRSLGRIVGPARELHGFGPRPSDFWHLAVWKALGFAVWQVRLFAGIVAGRCPR